VPDPTRLDGASQGGIAAWPGSPWTSALLAGMLVLMILAFVPGLEQPGKTPREILLLAGAPLLLALSLFAARQRPNGALPGLLGIAVLAGALGAALATEAERLAVARDLAVTIAPWAVAIAVSLLASSREDEDHLDTWTEIAVIVALVPLGLLGLAQAWFGWTGLEQSLPPAGTFVNRNVAAQALVVSIPLTVPPLLTGRHGWVRWGAGLAAGLGCAFLIATRSRGAWLGFLIGSAVAAAVWWAGKSRPLRPRWAPIGLAVGLAGAALFVPVSGPVHPLPSVRGTLGTLPLATEGSGEVRLAMWRNTVVLVAGNPWLGVGAGRFEVEYPAFQTARVPTPGFGTEKQLEHTHNDPLELAATLGVPVGLLILALLGGAIFRSIREGTRTRSRLDAVRWAARAAAVSGVLAHGLVSFPLHAPATAFVVWLLVGRCWASGAVTSPPLPARRLLAGVALAVVPFAAWVGWRELMNQSSLSEAIRETHAERCESAIVKANDAARYAPWKRREVGMAAMIHFRCETDPTRSLAVLEPALAMHRNQLNLLLAVGARRLKAQRPSEAASAFRHCVEVAPTLARGWLGLAMSQLALGDRRSAGDACTRALQLDGESAPIRAFCIGNGLAPD